MIGWCQGSVIIGEEWGRVGEAFVGSREMDDWIGGPSGWATIKEKAGVRRTRRFLGFEV